MNKKYTIKLFSFLLTIITVFVFCFASVSAKSTYTRNKSRDNTSGNILDSKQRRIVGIWVDVKNGTDGWASFSKKGTEYNVN